MRLFVQEPSGAISVLASQLGEHSPCRTPVVPEHSWCDNVGNYDPEMAEIQIVDITGAFCDWNLDIVRSYNQFTIV